LLASITPVLGLPIEEFTSRQALQKPKSLIIPAWKSNNNRFVALAWDASKVHYCGSDIDNAILGDTSQHWYMSLSVVNPRKGLFAENISFTKLNIETVSPSRSVLLFVTVYPCLCTSCGYMCMHRCTYKEDSQAWILRVSL